MSGPTAAALQYDPLGRLWRVVMAAGTVELGYDGDAMVSLSTGAVFNRYVHGEGADDPLVWYRGTGLADRRSLQADQQGSIVSMTDANGAPLWIDSYDEYGIPGRHNAGTFQYTGQFFLPWIGLYYYKARMYSPTLGRFLQTDPIGYDDQVNLYAHVANDPVNWRDTAGLSGNCDWCKQISEALAAVNRELEPNRVVARIISLIPRNADSVDNIQRDIEHAETHPIEVISELVPDFVGSGIPVLDPVARAPSASTSTASSQGPRFARGRLRAQVLAKGRQSDGTVRCAYCEKPTATTSDHIIPYSKEGPTKIDNLAPSCRPCNSSKGNKTLGEEWISPKDRISMNESTCIVCSHIFNNERPVEIVVRHSDGVWQAVCGRHDHPQDCSNFEVIGLEHLFERQENLASLTGLQLGWLAEWTPQGWSFTVHDD